MEGIPAKDQLEQRHRGPWLCGEAGSRVVWHPQAQV